MALRAKDRLDLATGADHTFFAAISFSIALSSIASAKSFLLGVLVFQRLQALGVRHVEAAILGLPLVERRTTDLSTSFMLPQKSR